MEDITLALCLSIAITFIYLLIFFVGKFFLEDDPNFTNLGSPFALALVIFILSFVIIMVVRSGQRKMLRIKF